MGDPRELIAATCDEIKKMLLAKNEAYGNSALDPVRVFSSANLVEQIKVRLDDKLSRLARGGLSLEKSDESYLDTVRDLVGYLILLLIALENGNPKTAGGE